MDLTPRTRLALEANLADQEVPRSARFLSTINLNDESAAQRKECLLVPRAPSAFGTAAAQATNLKQLAARAATPTGSGPSTPRGANRDKDAAALSHRSPRQGDQTPRGAASPAPCGIDAVPAPAPAALGNESRAALREALRSSSGNERDAEVPATVPSTVAAATTAAAARTSAPARTQPTLHIDVPPEGPTASPPPAAHPSAEGELHMPASTAASQGFWRTRSSASGLPPVIHLSGHGSNRRTTMPGGLTAAEILLMEAQRPSRADDDAELHWVHGSSGGASAAVTAHARAVQAAVTKESTAAEGLAGDDATPVSKKLPCWRSVLPAFL